MTRKKFWFWVFLLLRYCSEGGQTLKVMSLHEQAEKNEQIVKALTFTLISAGRHYWR